MSIAIVTFSRYVNVFELQNPTFVKSTIMDGKEKISVEDIQKMLSVDKKDEIHRYVQPLETARKNILEIIEYITPDPWICLQTGRAERTILTALNACLALGISFKNFGGRVVCCLGGPATIGEGTVASLKKEEIMRAHFDLEQETEKAKVFKDAYTVYEALSKKFIASNLTVDIFGFSTDQFGLAEMKPLVDCTGGLVFMHEEFNDQVFIDNFKNYFALNEFGELKVCSGGTLNMHVSAPLLIKGAMGPVHSLLNKSKMASQDKVAECETNSWFIGGLDHNLSITFFLDLMQGKNAKTADNNAYIQFATRYKHPTGSIFLRVTTIVRNYLEKSNALQYLVGVDQETVIAVYSKMAARRSMDIDPVAVIRWLDRTLINIMKKYSQFRKGVVESFQVCEELYLLPQFFYYLRKGNLVRKFATSVDEACYYRLCIDRENVANSLIMIQPSLTQYDLENENPVAAICDIESMKDDVILLMDSYFHIVVWHGGNIAGWVREGYHNQEGYENLKAILESPTEDIKVAPSNK